MEASALIRHLTDHRLRDILATLCADTAQNDLIAGSGVGNTAHFNDKNIF
jgi:hypothetical protein